MCTSGNPPLKFTKPAVIPASTSVCVMLKPLGEQLCVFAVVQTPPSQRSHGVANGADSLGYPELSALPAHAKATRGLRLRRFLHAHERDHGRGKPWVRPDGSREAQPPMTNNNSTLNSEHFLLIVRVISPRDQA